MIEKSCRCGKIKKNFKIDIGPFFIADCCTEAGYDHLGNRFEPETIGLDKVELEKAIESSDSLQIIDEGEQEESSEEVKSEETSKKKSKRSYNRNGNIKKEL